MGEMGLEGLEEWAESEELLGSKESREWEMLSNGKYPRCLHQVITNKLYPRTSVALFYSPSHSARIKPTPALIDEEHPTQYCEFVYGEYLKNFYRNGGPNIKVILGQFESEMKKKPMD